MTVFSSKLNQNYIVNLLSYWNWNWKACLIYSVTLLLIFLHYCWYLPSSDVKDDKLLSDISCYNKSDDDQILNVYNKKLTPEKTIFFLESSCKGGLDSRQACAVESAARANPDWTIVVLFTGPLSENYKTTSQALLSMDNVKFARLNVSQISKGTEVESLYSSNIFQLSKHPVVHNSDVLRMLLLNKFGGLYLDLDVIVMKSFNSLPKDFITEEDALKIGSSIMGLSAEGTGIFFTDLALKELRQSYSTETWSGNGPQLIERTMKKLCDTEDVTRWTTKTCKGMMVFGPEYFYPIRWQEWRRYYAVPAATVNDARAYTHHVWNHIGGRTHIKPDCLFAKLADQYCPYTYNMYGNRFGT